MKRREFLQNCALTMASVAALGSNAAGGVSIKNNVLDARNGQKRPNILFMMSDQHRFDSLGCAGNTVIKTPNLDRIAAEGAYFKNAYSCTPTCTPARSAILTGLNPWNHGMLCYGRVSSKYKYEMPLELRKAGYYLHGIGKNHWYPQRLLRGYHSLQTDESGRRESVSGEDLFISDYRRWFAKNAPGQNPDATGIGWNSYRAAPYALKDQLHPTTWTGSMACEFINNYNRNQPFMMKVSFARPHSPYDAPQKFWDMYNRDDIQQPWIGSWASGFAPRSSSGDQIWHGDLGVAQAKESRHGYYGNVSFIDQQVGRVIKALKKKGIYDNTLIIFTADHGDMLGDHHHWRKSYPFEGSTHVPMLMRWPDSAGATISRGSTITEPVELRDLFPTFMDAAKTKMTQSVDGDSMLKLVTGRGSSWRKWIDLEHDTCYSRNNKWHSLTDGRYKYIYYATTGQEMLFDLQSDPKELTDKSSSMPTELALWRERLVDHLSVRGNSYVSGGKLARRSSTRTYSPNYPG